MTASRVLNLVLGPTVQENVLINRSKVIRGPLRWLRAGALALRREAEGNGLESVEETASEGPSSSLPALMRTLRRQWCKAGA